MSAADSGVMPAHGASSSQLSRRPTTPSPIGLPHRAEHLAREPEPVRAVVVVATVGEPRQELADE